MSEPKIIVCEVGPYPKSMFDPMPEVRVKYDDGTVEKLFDFYPDEISFTAKEFVGLTRKEAIHLKFEKDKAYIQS